MGKMGPKHPPQRWKSMAVVVAWCTSCVGTTRALSLLPPLVVSRFHGRWVSPFTAKISSSSNLNTPLEAATSANHEEAEDAGSVRLRAAVFQPPITRSSKRGSLPNNDNDQSTSSEPTNPLEGLTRVADALQMAARCQIDVVQFPELFLHELGQPPLDRESTALNVVGNLCAQLNVACIVGYAEAPHASEKSNSQTTGASAAACYSSLAVFHADGSRAGNYRCVHPAPEGATTAGLSLDPGVPLLEAIPIAVRLPTRALPPTLQESLTLEPTEPTSKAPREVRLGLLCGGDLAVPEQARYLAHLGAELLAVAGSVGNAKAALHLPPARSLETRLPLLFANFVDQETTHDTEDDEDETTKQYPTDACLAGRSAVVAADGTELVRAPESLFGDMPAADGYLVPCETGGALYAADLEVVCGGKTAGGSGNTNRGVTSVEASVGEWTIAPRIHDFGATNVQSESAAAAAAASSGNKGFGKASGTEQPKPSKGFGREVAEMLQHKQTKKQRSKR